MTIRLFSHLFRSRNAAVDGRISVLQDASLSLLDIVGPVVQDKMTSDKAKEALEAN
jgi:hypothetical protein